MTTNIHQLNPETIGFDEFWAVCPKQVGKLLSRRKFDAITGAGLETRCKDETKDEWIEYKGKDALKATPDELIYAMSEYRNTQIKDFSNTIFADIADHKYKLKDDGDYTLHPATFLNKGRFLDYL